MGAFSVFFLCQEFSYGELKKTKTKLKTKKQKQSKAFESQCVFSDLKLGLLSSHWFLKSVTFVPLYLIRASGCDSPGLSPCQTVSQHP